uniref:Uncharacterized protein n=1 Tax=Streptomyces ambofaciens TaxID=1889 RepID=Q0JWR2_STRAM|nr:hypothetical protein DSMT0015 [Streptomyces ambofaciens]CAK51096.1 hypothetical protein DSMT0015 [Streptomyces ambofaciens]
MRAAGPQIGRFNAALHDLLGDDGFNGTSAALHRLAHWNP